MPHPSPRLALLIGLLLGAGATVTACQHAAPTAAAPDAQADAAPVSPATASLAPSVDAGSTRSAPAPFVSGCTDIVLTIGVRKSKEVFELDATLTNEGKAPVALVRTGDGSTGGRRNPSLVFELRPDTPAPEGRCGMMNAFEDADFVTLLPKQKLPLEWILPPPPAKPGRYTLRATYRNEPGRVDTGAQLTEAQRTRHERTVPCEVTSNTLTFDWNGKTATAR